MVGVQIFFLKMMIFLINTLAMGSTRSTGAESFNSTKPQFQTPHTHTKAWCRLGNVFLTPWPHLPRTSIIFMSAVGKPSSKNNAIDIVGLFFLSLFFSLKSVVSNTNTPLIKRRVVLYIRCEWVRPSFWGSPMSITMSILIKPQVRLRRGLVLYWQLIKAYICFC